MNPVIREMLVFGSGAVISAIVVDRLLRAKYDAILNEELESVKEMVERREKKRQEKEAEVLEDGETFATEEEMEMLEKDSAMRKAAAELAEQESPEDDQPKGRHPRTEQANQGPIDYTKYAKPGSVVINNVFADNKLVSTVEQEEEDEEVPEGNLDNTDFYDDPADPAEFNSRDCDEPYVITLEEFSAERMDFDKTSISYYEEDDTLLDDGDEVIDDVDGTIGDSALSSFGEGNPSPDVVYVRNERLGTDFEVVRHHASYQEAVLGVKRARRGTPAARDPKNPRNRRADMNE